MDYHSFRAFADSWFLLAMTLFFLGAILWACWPGRARREAHDAASTLIFRNEARPEAAPATKEAA
ncbi:cbb3-type cytochrome c oxidase subunit 3 [Frigidibacter sp. MR17.24]|uniref:cbb3-type cytochrome c oxidase subunit 3 n=1 Tax=Frigidibacter sp. MR17.24 TaxID=3127345 RepID=UPI003012F55A